MGHTATQGGPGRKREAGRTKRLWNPGNQTRKVWSSLAQQWGTGYNSERARNLGSQWEVYYCSVTFKNYCINKETSGGNKYVGK